MTIAIMIIGLLWLRGAWMCCRVTAKVSGLRGYTLGCMAESLLWPIWWLWGDL